MADINKIYELIPKEKFEPTEVSDKDRIEAIEEAVMELAEMMIGGEQNG